MATAKNLSAPRPKVVRQMSSKDSTAADLYGGPTVVVPPKHLMAGPDRHNKTIQELAWAKHHLDETSSSEDTSPMTGSPVLDAVSGDSVTTTTDKYAFAFDIDGVLIRGGEPIPEAVQAMRMLNGENEYGVTVCVLVSPTSFVHMY
jgi:hypothetical protein